jgi:hypothetical protein
MIPSG